MKPSAYTSYKPSGVAWLGEVPAHWEVKSARFGYSIQLGKMLQPEQGNETETEVPYLKSQHVQWEAIRIDELPTMWASATEEIKYGVKEGDLLVCEGGDVGRAGIVINPPPSTIIQNALHRVRSYKENNLRFLMYVLEHAATQGWFEILCNRSTIAHFTAEKFGALRLPMPSVEEQQTIADFLDTQTAKIDTLLAKKRQLIAKLKEKRGALIARTVTRGLPPDAAQAAGLEPHPAMKNSGVQWIGHIPRQWAVLPFKKRARFIEGPGIMAADFLDEGVPLLRIAGLSGRFASLDGANYLDSELVAKKWAHFKTKIGDLLISGSASTGLCCEVNEVAAGAIPYTGVIIIRSIASLSCREFLLWYFQSEQFLVQVGLLKTGSTIQHFGPSHLSQMVISIPETLKEQQAIAAYLDRETARIDQLTAKVEAAISRLTEYRQALITAAVTGKIDVRAKLLKEDA